MIRSIVFWPLLCFGMTAEPLSSQSCTALPQSPNELWLGGGAMQEAGVRWNEVALEASPGGSFGIAVNRVTGGRNENDDLEAWGVRLGVPFLAGKIGLCLFGGFELNDFSFENRFEMDRGEADYLARNLGLKVEVPLVTFNGAALWAWVAPAATFLKYEVSGRTLLVDGEISVEERNLGASMWEASGQLGLSVRWRFIGVAGGLTKRPALTSGTLAFIRIGVAVIPIPSISGHFNSQDPPGIRDRQGGRRR